MRFQGKISDWNDERGFGFVTPNGGGPKAFLH
ncbi:MAG: cold-shock protein, partial [Pseudanabaena sp.]